MTAHARPYSPETLAERWGCSAEKVRDAAIARFSMSERFTADIRALDLDAILENPDAQS